MGEHATLMCCSVQWPRVAHVRDGRRDPWLPCVCHIDLPAGALTSVAKSGCPVFGRDINRAQEVGNAPKWGNRPPIPSRFSPHGAPNRQGGRVYPPLSTQGRHVSCMACHRCGDLKILGPRRRWGQWWDYTEAVYLPSNQLSYCHGSSERASFLATKRASLRF